MKQTICMKINGVDKFFDVEADTKLIDVLRDAGYMSVKRGCDEGSCGSCTVIMDGRAVYSCIMYAFQAHGRSIETTEMLSNPASDLHPMQEAFLDAGAVQCGFCIPGMLMSVKAMVDEIVAPTDEDIRLYMDGNLCRCTGYEKIWNAVHTICAQKKDGDV